MQKGQIIDWGMDFDNKPENLTTMEIMDFEDVFRMFSRSLQHNATNVDNGLDVEIALPGVQRDDITLQTRERDNSLSLIISGKYWYLQGYDSTPHVYRVGEEYDVPKVTSSLKDGVLKIHIPFKKDPGIHTVKID